MPSARTEGEIREKFLNVLHGLVDYWALQESRNIKKKLDGLTFSILVLIDGDSIELPAMDLVMRPHPKDKQYDIGNGNDWVEDGTVITSEPLHEHWYGSRGGPSCR